MINKARSPQRREDALSRERIVEASIALLDSRGESGLTFRALADALATGAGAIYWHIDNKRELLTAASDAVVARTIGALLPGAAPPATVRALALGMFDAIRRHPWIGAALTGAPGQLPVVRMVECIGQQIRAMGVPEQRQWSTVSALLSYILGVAGQNGANAQLARQQGFDRSGLLDEVAAMWSRLDAAKYPFARSIAGHLRTHDDRDDFLAGIDLIMAGVATSAAP
ncbi:TetR/AcrR family transcriptional regulator [Xanthomonas hortorum]|uniref:TetR/AcrR family transcriptional regulator n=1 Tax=Xanthomonas hortorum TaxID=56454 RepID=UPI0015D63396|nr:TetR/AcrR family transcriptional regulator [Xanthomonas hortorum]MCE4357251.1 TetR family transcriptional regulator [Xanthomonas hortorum pv. taraxaci]NMI52185.1 TetR/AcrR family transcriptional regulator [Xanthomonas hortorum pv. taraxaci]CAD0318401.1 hypothetical protein NCPPB940_14750 [Xanthomonas hortorum pv. taraxaci]CAD0318413.1 hypothetical protein NCPPB940_14750 [Xanthomonas hortorum pv. taraxaci]